MSLFGLGSMCGAYLGGWLTDRIGHFIIQITSLIAGGSLFFVLLQLTQFHTFAIGIFILSLVTECLRPANASSVAYYAKNENVTRAFSLNRMAMNLGFSIGPALGGFLASVSYKLLFMADGFTCIAAGIFFYFYFRNQQGSKPKTKAETSATTAIRSPYRDGKFLIFAALTCLFAIVFFQFFTTLPLYYRQVYLLSEAKIGTLLALNGIFVFLVEMVVVYLAGQRFKLEHLLAVGTLFTGFSFVLLNLLQGLPVLYTAMIILSISEILAMPFMATITVQRSTDSNRGAYMGLYTLSYSLAHVLGPYLGTSIIASFGFNTLWWCAGALCLFTAVGFYFLVPKLKE
ncbi:MAG: MFS transporter, partial [Hymenobacteraceae bacterium]|nr:MFS transporter [Hymenobacteraceae bacterium]MDX5396857.1 MFS transporter [Hymenobacteraceae bacterium]MDX5512930.1 MFS transporter [Hymenobacteraceae bacterium]